MPDVLQTGAWILPDKRPLPAELVAFLDAGEPPGYVGFGSMRRVPEDIAQVAIGAIRAQGRRALVGHGWADLALVDDRDDCFVVGEVNQQAPFGRVAAGVHHGGAAATWSNQDPGVFPKSKLIRLALSHKTRDEQGLSSLHVNRGTELPGRNCRLLSR